MEEADGSGQGAIDLVVEAVDFALSGEGDEGDFPGVAGLEADGVAGGDVEAEAAGPGAVEGERGVDLEEMEMVLATGRRISARPVLAWMGGAPAAMRISPGIIGWDGAR